MQIKKVVIPAAGHGTRFLPITKAVPKEMLPLLNKPAIHYIVQEAINSALCECIIITSHTKKAISDYFAPIKLAVKHKDLSVQMDQLTSLIEATQFTYIVQEHAKGLGHAIGLAQNEIEEEYFGVMLPDDIIVNKNPGLGQLIEIATKHNASVIAVQEVLPEAVSAYGVIAIKEQLTCDLFSICGVVEKPVLKDAPSNLAIIGRYILSHKIFKVLDEVKPAANGEIQLTDGIQKLIADGEPVLAYKLQGTRYDVGTPSGWLDAILGFAANDPLYARQITEFCKKL